MPVDYHAHRQRGLCTKCNKPAIYRRTLCRDCQDRRARTKHTKKALGICQNCPQPAKAPNVLCDDCSKKGDAYYQGVKARGVCTKCRGPRDSDKRLMCGSCAEKRHAAFRIKQIEVFNIVFEAYGDKCACCGETERAFLTIDHKNNDGAAHRRGEFGTGDRGSITGGGGLRMHVWLIKHRFPSDFQLLCYNCNCVKQRMDVCPHQAPVTKERFLRAVK